MWIYGLMWTVYWFGKVNDFALKPEIYKRTLMLLIHYSFLFMYLIMIMIFYSKFLKFNKNKFKKI